MTQPDSRLDRARARDAARRRLQRLTFATVAGATALVGLFAGIAAKAVPGRKTVATPPKTTASAPRTATIPAAPAPIVPVEGGGSAAAAPSASAPAAPSQAPAQSVAPPVVSSGGS